MFDPSEILASLPHRPGVYRMLNAAGEVIYVGKALDLRKRVSSYFRSGANHGPRTRIMVAQVAGAPSSFSSSASLAVAAAKKLGYVRGDTLTILEPRKKLEQLKPDFATGDATPVVPVNQDMVNTAIAYYQVASDLYKQGKLVRRPSDSTRVEPLPAPATTAAAPAAASSVQ